MWLYFRDDRFDVSAEEEKPEVSYGRNDVLVEASSCVCREYSESKGRYLVVSTLS